MTQQNAGIGNLKSDVQRLWGELEKYRILSRDVADLKKTVQTAGRTIIDIQNQELPPIINEARNTDFTYSVDTWHNSAAAGGKQADELAHYYVHAKDSQTVLYDGTINSGTPDLSVPSAAFVLGDVGKTIIIDGAGVTNAPLVTTINAYVSPTAVTLSANASTSVSNSRVRYNVVQLAKRNALTHPADAVTEVVKAQGHAEFASNLKSPKWDNSTGQVELGSTDSLTYFHGFTNSAGAFARQIQPFRPGTNFWVLFKMAKANKFVKPKGYFYAGLWDNSDSGREFLKASDFTLSASVTGAPTSTATARYMVVVYTGAGRVYKSKVVTVANAPSLSSFNPPDVQVVLSWTGVPGVIRTEVYREIGGGNVFLLESYASNTPLYYDINPATRQDTGSSAFPAISAASHIECFTQTNDFRALPVNNHSAWQFYYLQIPVPAATDFSRVTELAIRMGLTENMAFECAGISTLSGAIDISAPEAAFYASLAGKNFILYDAAEPNRRLTGTIALFKNALSVDLSAPVTWTSSTNVIEIADAQPHGLLMDLLGVSLNRGKWAKHRDDERALAPIGVPPSTQGEEPTVIFPGSGGCVLEGNTVDVLDEETGEIKKIDSLDLREGHLCYYGEPGVFNRVSEIEYGIVTEYWEITLPDGRQVEVTDGHRFVTHREAGRYGMPTKYFKTGDKILPDFINSAKLVSIDKRLVQSHRPKIIVKITLDEVQDRPQTCHLLITSGILSHNSKQPILEVDA